MGKPCSLPGCRLEVLALVLVSSLAARAAEPVSTIIADFDQKTPAIGVSDDTVTTTAGEGPQETEHTGHRA